MTLNLPETEQNILNSWKKNKIFEKSLEKTKNGPKFVFYEGPPFANGLPGIHHLLARALKDVILRYKTMQGFFVERKAGWDTHGLPTEMAAEKSLGIKSKKEIEEDINKFIEECRNSVFTYKKEWEEFTERIGYWLDLKNSYITCSNEYIESLWWILKQIWDKKLLYQDYKVVPYCPRCGTSLSSHEVAQGYKAIREPVIYVKLKIKSKTHNLKPNTYLLVWTTTPWTLPGNVAVAINQRFIYAVVKTNGEYLILAKDRIEASGVKGEIVEEFKGENLLGIEYEPLFNFIKPDKKAYFVVPGDFVSIEEGTGLVHMAPAFGEDDMEVGKENNLPVLMTVDETGCLKPSVKQWAGMFVKDADPLIIKDLEKRGLIFKKELYEHDYPFCWRCDSPLLYYAKQSWFIKVTAVKDELIKNNKKINWVPDYIKEGRFGEWLKEVKDWNLSRERYWGTPLPIWQCEKCKETICIGSIEELKKKAGVSEINDLHRPHIDEIFLKCDCKGDMKRVPEVVDCWFDSGAMPFAQWHYPFENKDRIDKGEFFPADFICEGVDQTRGWFYTLLVISTILGLGNSYRNVISHGIVLDTKGRKMSKSKGNVIKPSDVIDEYGADVARFYFYTVNPVGEPKRFDFKDVQTLYRRFFNTLINAEKFFVTYTKEEFKPKEDFKSENLLDRWIVSILENLNSQIIEKLDNYDIVGAARLFEELVENLSNWYIRRSRKRFHSASEQNSVRGKKVSKDFEDASQTLYYVLLKLTQLLAPFTPFISDSLYKDLGGKKESVHLRNYPISRKDLIDEKLEEEMRRVREIVNLGLKERARLGIKVRQPLKEIVVGNLADGLKKELKDLIKEELNVKNFRTELKLKEKIKLDEVITVKLREEGMVREIIRNIQEMRKQISLRPEDEIFVWYSGTSELNEVLAKNKEFILKEAKARDLILREKSKKVFDTEREVEIDNRKLWIGIKKY